MREILFRGKRTDKNEFVYGSSSHTKRTYLKVRLHHNCHNEPPEGVHFNKEVMDYLHQTGQIKAMEYYRWSIEEFRAIFGKNYI